uniref:Ovule protein n=1 Tax=Heterorhabditis bacteriophora TaxID=37862 RepID=A0A1I7XBM2_HETBA
MLLLSKNVTVKSYRSPVIQPVPYIFDDTTPTRLPSILYNIPHSHIILFVSNADTFHITIS